MAFGWINGSSSIQLIADIITHIMKQKGFQVFAYIADFILVNNKHKARKPFDTLYNLFTELGLPMNEDKTVPLLKNSHVWVYILIYSTILLVLIVIKSR